LKVPLYRAPPTRLSRTAPGRPSGGEQLQNALTSRIAIEQAKGVLAERNGLSLDAAFDALRRHARDHNLKLTAVANEVVHARLDPTDR
jgi:ANTAR domain